MTAYIIDYKGQHSRRKPRIKMLTGCTWWSEGGEYNVQYEDNVGLYINDESGGTAVVELKDEGKDFVYVRKAKPELKESLRKEL